MSTRDPITLCETFLRSSIQYNIEHNILPSENAVAQRLLDRSVELRQAYEELVEQAGEAPGALGAFLSLLLTAAAFRHPAASAQSRADRAELSEVNVAISVSARQLQCLLLRRAELHNTSDFHSNTHYSVHDVIESAGKQVPLFGPWVQQRLQALSSQFDSKYWPSIAACVGEIAEDADRAESLAIDRSIELSTHGQRASPADFFAYLLTNYDENSTRYGGLLPEGFKLSDKSIAAFGTCALGRAADQPFSAEYVKNLRLRLRSRDEAV